MIQVLSMDQALGRAAAMASSRAPRPTIGIVGPPGAGKSTLAEQVVSAVAGSVLVPMDGFHLAQAVLDEAGLADRKGAPETFDRHGYVAVLRRAAAQHPGDPPVYAPTFRRDLEEPVAGAVRVDAEARLVVTEGNYLMHWPEVRAVLSEVWWVDADPSRRIERLVNRHVHHGRSPEAARAWVLRSDEANARLVASGRDDADVLVSVP